MSQIVEPREVLSYLNELGYTNINAQQLKEFIIDLKKLMKYDQRKHNRDNIENINPNKLKKNDVTEPDSLPKRGNNCCICDMNEANIFNTLYNQTTVASRAKEVPKKEKQISVHITKKVSNKDNPKQHDLHCIEITEKIQRTKDKENSKNIEQCPDSEGTKVTVETESSVRPNSEGKVYKPLSSRNVSKKTSRPSTATTKVNKSDPVALYHHYKSEWEKHKIPGHDNRLDLRWSIREKMKQGPKIQTTSARRQCNSVR